MIISKMIIIMIKKIIKNLIMKIVIQDYFVIFIQNLKLLIFV